MRRYSRWNCHHTLCGINCDQIFELFQQWPVMQYLQLIEGVALDFAHLLYQLFLMVYDTRKTPDQNTNKSFMIHQYFPKHSLHYFCNCFIFHWIP